MICAIEGIDASGKQTATKRVKELIARRELFDRVEAFDFPHYESTAGALVGRVLRGDTLIIDRTAPSGDNRDSRPHWRDDESLRSDWSRDKALAIQCAMLVNRFEHYPMLAGFGDVGEFSNPDDLLILDRYSLSGIVYGQADGLDRDWLFAIHAALPTPEVTIVLDLPVEESVRRRPERADYYEKNLPKLRIVRDLYLGEAATDPVGMKVIDAMLDPDLIAEKIVAAIETERDRT